MGDEPGYTVGFSELYSELKILSDKLTDYMNAQNVHTAEQDFKISQMSTDLEGMQNRMDAEKGQRDALSRQFWFSLLSSLVLPIMVLLVGGWIMTKGA